MLGKLGNALSAVASIPGVDKIPGASTVINGARTLGSVASGDFGEAMTNLARAIPGAGTAIDIGDTLTGGRLTDFVADKINDAVPDKLKSFMGSNDPMQGDFSDLGYDDSSFGDFINTGRFSNPSSSSWLGDDDDFGPGSFNGRAGMNGNNLADLYSDEDLGVGGFGNNGGMQSTGNPDLDAIVNAKNPARALAGLDDADRAQLMSSLNPQQSAALRNAVNNGPGADHSLDGLFDGMGIEQRGAAAQAKLEEISAGLEGLGADKTSELMRDKLGKLIEKTFDQAEFDIIASYLQMYQNLLNMLLGKDRAHAEGTVQKYGR